MCENRGSWGGQERTSSAPALQEGHLGTDAGYRGGLWPRVTPLSALPAARHPHLDHPTQVSVRVRQDSSTNMPVRTPLCLIAPTVLSTTHPASAKHSWYCDQYSSLPSSWLALVPPASIQPVSSAPSWGPFLLPQPTESSEALPGVFVGHLLCASY